jgi:anti-sigma-K factor RskA
LIFVDILDFFAESREKNLSRISADIDVNKRKEESTNKTSKNWKLKRLWRNVLNAESLQNTMVGCVQHVIMRKIIKI